MVNEPAPLTFPIGGLWKHVKWLDTNRLLNRDR